MQDLKIKCSKCGKKAVPIKVVYKHRRSQFIFVVRCPKHKTKLLVDEKEIDDYFIEFFKDTLECQFCGSKIPQFEELNLIIREEFLIITKKCNHCKRKISFAIINVLISRFFDLYFNFFKINIQSEDLFEYQKILTCPNCNNALIIENITNSVPLFKNDRISYIKGICAGPDSHKFRLELPTNIDNDWLKFLPEMINKCDFCKSDDMAFKELNFIYTDDELLSDIYGRELVKICKNCKNVKKIQIPYHFYELYHRFMKEKKINNSESPEISCPICQNEVLLDKLKINDLTTQAHLLCKERHRTTLELETIKKSSWIQSILSITNKCSKCWSSDQKLIAIKIKWPWTRRGFITEHKFVLQCKDCNNKRNLISNNIIFNELMDYFKNQFSEDDYKIEIYPK